MSASQLFRYAGVGSRQTPPEILKSMELIGAQLSGRWHLTSGYADGADMAFGRGAEQAGGEYTMYLPWQGFNGAPQSDPRFVIPEFGNDLLQRASQAHPAWGRLSGPVRKLQARNVAQVLGEQLNQPVECVICWTPNGRGGGGTGQAIRIAVQHGIPVFDLAIEANKQKLCDFIQEIENTKKT